MSMAPLFTPAFYKSSKVGNAIWFRRWAYLILEFSNASFLATSHHSKWQAFSVGLRLGHLAKWFNVVVWRWFWCPLLHRYMLVWSQCRFSVLAVNERFGFSSLHFEKLQSRLRHHAFFPTIFNVNFQEVILGSKTCMPWHVIKVFSVWYNHCHFVETLSVQLCLPPSPTRQCWKKFQPNWWRQALTTLCNIE